jgi:hypothetical protein
MGAQRLGFKAKYGAFPLRGGQATGDLTMKRALIVAAIAVPLLTSPAGAEEPQRGVLAGDFLQRVSQLSKACPGEEIVAEQVQQCMQELRSQLSTLWGVASDPERWLERVDEFHREYPHHSHQ